MQAALQQVQTTFVDSQKHKLVYISLLLYFFSAAQIAQVVQSMLFR